MIEPRRGARLQPRPFVFFALVTLSCGTGSNPSGTASAAGSTSATSSTTAPSPPTSPSARAPAPNIDGRWRVERSNRPTAPEGGFVFNRMVGLTVAITAGVMTWEQDGSFNEKGERVLDKHRKTIHLDASTTPMIFDLEQGPEAKGWSRVGIVRIDGDMMTICVDFPQYPRPTSFEGQGSQEVVTLRRAR